MQKLTVKDFVFHNAPCFSCGKQVNIRLLEKNNSAFKYNYFNCYFRDASEFYFCLISRYNKSKCLNLKIDISNNKYFTNNKKQFQQFIIDRDLRLSSNCICGNVIISSKLEFDNLFFIKGISIYSESLYIKDNESDTVYLLNSNFEENKTIITVFDKNRIDEFKMSLFCLDRFKTKENFLEKMKFYKLLL